MSETATQVKKPWRIWILEAIAAIQVLGGVVRLVPRLIRTAFSHVREPAVLGWLLGATFALAMAVLLFAALERWPCRPELVAPAVGFLWWARGVFSAVNSFGHPPAPDLKPFLFENVSPVAEGAGIAIVHGLLLVLVGSLLWHRQSRAYLVARA